MTVPAQWWQHAESPTIVAQVMGSTLEVTPPRQTRARAGGEGRKGGGRVQGGTRGLPQVIKSRERWLNDDACRGCFRSGSRGMLVLDKVCLRAEDQKVLTCISESGWSAGLSSIYLSHPVGWAEQGETGPTLMKTGRGRPLPPPPPGRTLAESALKIKPATYPICSPCEAGDNVLFLACLMDRAPGSPSGLSSAAFHPAAGDSMASRPNLGGAGTPTPSPADRARP